jgi:hypothetical protein
MRKFLSAVAIVGALMSASAANAASLFFDFDEGLSVFKVTSSTPICPFQPSSWCKITGKLAANPFDNVSIAAGDTYDFNFGQLFVGFGVGRDTDSQVSATLAFTSPTAPSASTSGNVAYVTALGLVSAGTLTWYNPVHSLTAADGSQFTVTFRNISGLAFGGSAFAPVSITVDSVAVPEPATWALMIGGFGMVGATLRRRRPIALTA